MCRSGACESEVRFRELADNMSQFAWTAGASGRSRRAERAVRLIKRYVSATKRYIPIVYDGGLSGAGDRIAGRRSPNRRRRCIPTTSSPVNLSRLLTSRGFFRAMV
jgi:hypothetical protein